MKRCLTIGVVLAALCAASTFAQARPPTVTNSPGYDARLKESRSQLGSSRTTTAPVNAPVAQPKRSKKKHTN
jgi:hypothetical protein